MLGQFGRRWRHRAAQRGQQRRHGSGPALRVPGKTALQYFPLAWCERVWHGRLMALAAQAIERHAPFHHLIDHDRHRIHVQRLAGLALQRSRLWRAIARSARVGGRFQANAACAAARACGNAEVEQFYITALRKEHVTRLDVAVDQLVLVPRILESFTDRREQLLHPFERERTFARQQAVQVFAFQAFHDDEVAGRGRILRPFVYPHDVLVRQASRLGSLFNQEPGVACALREHWRQYLERHQGAVAKLGVRGKVGRLPHLSHAALGDQALEPVAAVLWPDLLALHQANLGSLVDVDWGRQWRSGAARRRVLGVENGVFAAVEFLLADQAIFIQRSQFANLVSCRLHRSCQAAIAAPHWAQNRSLGAAA